MNHRPGREVAEAHPVRIAPGSRLSCLLPREAEFDPLVNSSHHQAIRLPGDGLVVSAVSSGDGVIEAVELDSREHFVLGVQWHPERTYTQSAFSRAIFAAFVAGSNGLAAKADCRIGRNRVKNQYEEAGTRLNEILAEFGQKPIHLLHSKRFEEYLFLLLRWNARVNLTAIRDEEGILRRHFVESIVCARALPAGITSLLDFGSGAGFPGIPIALCCPEIAVTLAESQGKKAAFLSEAVRVLGISAKVHSGRAEVLRNLSLIV